MRRESSDRNWRMGDVRGERERGRMDDVRGGGQVGKSNWSQVLASLLSLALLLVFLSLSTHSGDDALPAVPWLL